MLHRAILNGYNSKCKLKYERIKADEHMHTQLTMRVKGIRIDLNEGFRSKIDHAIVGD